MRWKHATIGMILVLGACTSNGLADTGLASAIERARPGDVIELRNVTYEGPIFIDKPITIKGVSGAVIDAPDGEPAIFISGTSDVSLENLSIIGGDAGIVVEGSESVSVIGVEIEQAIWHGILAKNSSIEVNDCLISGLRGPMAQGIEIRNSDSRPPSTVSGCRIEGPVFEGLVAHVSHVTFENNIVVGSQTRAVVITEMSNGAMVGNTVEDSRGSAYFCGDMSVCSIVDNSADRIATGDVGNTSDRGHGVVIHFHSNAFISGLNTDGIAGESILSMLGSTQLDESPYP